MKLGFFQYAVIQGNPEANFDYISNSLRYCRCDVLVLPELFSCGYCFSRRSEIMSCAESLSNSKTIRFLQKMAVETGGVVTGTFPELDDKEDVLYNTAAAVDQHGLLGIQRKVHLPEYEKQFFSPGCDVVPVEIQNGSKIGLMTCFDCWFPAFGALLKQSGAQIFCSSASFGGNVTPDILRVRARENQVFVISCNRIGSEKLDGELEHFCGKSQIISPDGKVLVSADGEEKIGLADVDLSEIDHPAFGSLICSDFAAEHRKYRIWKTSSGEQV